MEATRNPLNVTNSELAQIQSFQKEIIEIFSKEFSSLSERRQLYTNINTVARFSIAREFKREKIVEMWRNWIKWYEEFRPDQISESESKVNEIHHSGKYRFCGYDKAGCPVLVIRMKYHQVGLATADENLRYLIYMIEKGVKLAAQAKTYQLSVIYDRREMAESDDVSKESMKKFMPILNDYYPETLRAFYVLGANFFYRALWGIVSLFVSKRTEEKINLLSQDNQINLFIERSQLAEIDQVRPTSGMSSRMVGFGLDIIQNYIAVMGKMKVNNSSHMLGKPKKRLQEYFDPSHNNIVVPNQRSLPKYKHLFDKPRGKSSKKDHPKRPSQGKNGIRRQKDSFSPTKLGRSGQKLSKYEQSIGREYDSPSKDHEEIDIIFKGAQKKMKGDTFIENTIQKVNDHLKANRLQQAITVLNEALRLQPNNYDLIYLLAICYIFNSNYQEAIDIFQRILEGKAKKNIYLLLSVCYKKTDRFQQTEQILKECIQKFPKYYEAYIYRGKLYLKMKEFKSALQDFERAISLDSKKQIGYIGKGDCLRLIQRYQQARRMYSEAHANSKKNNISLLLRRAICSMELKRFEAALEDIETLLASDFQNSEALYFKGLIFNKLKKPNDAIICYEQAIKFNTNKRAVTRAIYEITKIKIQNRDYYEALYTLQRAQYLDIDEKVIKKFKIFINGVTSMMKKNYDEGVKILTQLAEDRDRALSNFLRPLFYSTRSYGYMALEEFHKARDDLENMENQFSLDLPNLYNKFICDGILACNNSKYENALTFFSKASKALPYRIQPAFYKAVTLINFSTKILPKQLKDKKKEYLQSAMRTIKKVQTIQNNGSLFMIRGLLHYALGDLDSALNDFDKCLNESIKPTPLIFYLIGMILAQTGRFQQAISEFKKAIQNDKQNKIPQVHLNLAKCQLIFQQVNVGFKSLQDYMSFRPSSPEIHLWAGHLLFYIEAYEDAVKAYSNINNINKNFQALIHKAKCYLAVKDVTNAITNLKYMLQIKTDSKVTFDYEILQSLSECNEQSCDYESILCKMKEAKKATGGSFGNIVRQFDYQFYKAVLYFCDKKYPEASKNFKRAIDIIEKEMSNNSPPLDSSFYKDFKKLSFGNRSFNYFQAVYNHALSEIMNGNLMAACKSLKNLLSMFPESELKDQFASFFGLIQKEVKDFSNKKNKDSDEQAQFKPFPDQNRLCSIFPQVVLPLSTQVRTRLFFCLPYIARPDITPRFQQKILEQFNMSSIQIKPEAPWIRRSDQGVIFTDQVIKYDIELSQSSSSKSSQQQEEQQDEDYVQNAEQLFQQGQHYHHKELSDERYGSHEEEDEEENNKRMTGNQLKEFFKLDKNTEDRLAKLRND